MTTSSGLDLYRLPYYAVLSFAVVCRTFCRTFCRVPYFLPYTQKYFKSSDNLTKLGLLPILYKQITFFINLLFNIYTSKLLLIRGKRCRFTYKIFCALPAIQILIRKTILLIRKQPRYKAIISELYSQKSARNIIYFVKRSLIIISQLRRRL